MLFAQSVVTAITSPKLCRAVRANPHGRRLFLTQDVIHLGEDSVRERAEVDAPVPTESRITRPVYAGDFYTSHLFINLNNPPLARWPRVQPPKLLPFARSPGAEIIPGFPTTTWPAAGIGGSMPTIARLSSTFARAATSGNVGPKAWTGPRWLRWDSGCAESFSGGNESHPSCSSRPRWAGRVPWFIIHVVDAHEGLCRGAPRYSAWGEASRVRGRAGLSWQRSWRRCWRLLWRRWVRRWCWRRRPCSTRSGCVRSCVPTPPCRSTNLIEMRAAIAPTAHARGYGCPFADNLRDLCRENHHAGTCVHLRGRLGDRDNRVGLYHLHACRVGYTIFSSTLIVSREDHPAGARHGMRAGWPLRGQTGRPEGAA